jgi:CRISPR system Cascade subunit CasC
MTARFLQIHTLISYPASLLNRDDVGFAKRVPFGGAVRTRISSQCLKRHWRTADDQNALQQIEIAGAAVPMAVRSRRTFEKQIYEPLISEGIDPEVARAAVEGILKIVLPEGKKRQGEREESEERSGGESSLRTQQVTVIGRPEVEYLHSLASKIAAGAKDAKAAGKAIEELNRGDLRNNLQALARGAGIDAAMFGRMTTGDVLARCDAAIHVAHALTVHDGQFETDYFSAIDDLQGPEETGSGHINTSELSSGLFYGYIVVDTPLLVSNLEGCSRQEWESADRTLAAEVVRRLVHLAATVSPGAKLGATAPYAHASMVLAESGARQPRSLANAFLRPVPLRRTGGCDGEAYDILQGAYAALADYLVEHDRMYGTHEQRRIAVQSPPERLLAAGGKRLDLAQLAVWAAACIRDEK